MQPVLENKTDFRPVGMESVGSFQRFPDIYYLICLATLLISLQMGLKRIKKETSCIIEVLDWCAFYGVFKSCPNYHIYE